MAEDRRTTVPDGADLHPHRICVPHTDLMTETGMGTQALFGQRFDVISTEGDWCHGVLRSLVPGCPRVDYIGRVESAALSDDMSSPTHRVTAVAGAVFEQADIKSKLIQALPRNAVVAGTLEGDFLAMSQGGFVHRHHVGAVGTAPQRHFTDVAADMLGLPYIWGGTGGIGVDCSGLVQSALAVIGVDAPRNTDQQEVELGVDIGKGARQTGDLVFWPGHVGIVTDGDILLHANAHHMCVAVEPVEAAIARIGAPSSTRRL